MKILIAEDERITRMTLQRQLERWEHEVTAAEDGQQAWERFQEEPFDLVITDWDMPRMDGRQLVAHIRESTRAQYSYVIMLTGRNETTDLVAGMEAGADDFLSKPFIKDELRVRVHAGERIVNLERELARKNARLSEANDKMREDLVAAAAVQNDLLPKHSPDTPHADFAWCYEPCDELGGDTLNMFLLDDRHLAMYLVDVSGHGVAAALLSVSLSQALTAREPGGSLLVENDPVPGGLRVNPPAKVARSLNRRFPFERQNYQFFTIVYAVLDTRTLMLRFVVAGHPTPILVRDGGSPQILPGSGPPIGVRDDADFEEHEIQLQPGDRLYFYSDGITEAFNAKDEMLETGGFCDLIAEKGRGSGIQESLDAIMAALRSWCGGRPFEDDVSIFALEVP